MDYPVGPEFRAMHAVQRIAEKRGAGNTTGGAGLEDMIGALLGFSGGPVGVAVGAAIGAAIGASLGYQADEKKREA